MRSLFAAAAALLLLVCAGSAHAQIPFTLDMRGGASIPAEDFGTIALDPGFGFGFTASARILPHASLYAGWAWTRMSTEVAPAGADSHLEDTGYAAGFVFQHPLMSRIEGWGRVGAIYNHVEMESPSGDEVADSGHELGWEAGAGFAIPVGHSFALTPGVRYRTFPAEIDLTEGNASADLSYVMLDVGLSYSFGGAPTRTAAR